MSRYNSQTINVQELISYLQILPPDSTMFINKLYELAWLPTDKNNPGGVVVFEDAIYGPHLNPNGELVLPYPEGSIVIHGV